MIDFEPPKHINAPLQVPQHHHHYYPAPHSMEKSTSDDLLLSEGTSASTLLTEQSEYVYNRLEKNINAPLQFPQHHYHDYPAPHSMEKSTSDDLPPSEGTSASALLTEQSENVYNYLRKSRRSRARPSKRMRGQMALTSDYYASTFSSS